MGTQKNLGRAAATINGNPTLNVSAQAPLVWTQTGVNAVFSINEVSTTNSGVMTASDKIKLNSFSSGDNYVQITRKINNKTLSSDITLTASDIGAADSSHTHSGNDLTTVVPITKGGTGNNTGYIQTGIKDGETAGACSTIEGVANTAAMYSHAEGYGVSVDGMFSHGEGYQSQCLGSMAHVEGYTNIADGDNSHAEGWNTTAYGKSSHSEGTDTVAEGNDSHAGGTGSIANGDSQTVIGKYNVPYSSSTNALFIVGNGTTSAQSNAFRVGSTSVWGGTYNSSGADYAEMFEWVDGNPDNEDRVGKFVTLVGEKIRLANSNDDFILGIVSGNPTILGDVHDDQWNGLYLTDVYRRPIFEDVEVESKVMTVVDPITREPTERIIRESHTERRRKLNPKYDSSIQYIPRKARKEWDAVGIMGKLVVEDDGKCAVDEYAKATDTGIATYSEKQTKFRVMSRIDPTHILVFVIPN